MVFLVTFHYVTSTVKQVVNVVHLTNKVMSYSIGWFCEVIIHELG